MSEREYPMPDDRPDPPDPRDEALPDDTADARVSRWEAAGRDASQDEGV